MDLRIAIQKNFMKSRIGRVPEDIKVQRFISWILIPGWFIFHLIKKRNVCYGNPVYFDDFIYFLQGDFNRKEIALLKYLPEQCCEHVCRFNIEDISLYNLHIVTGDQVYVVGQENGLAGYYPARFVCPLEPNESIVCIEKNRLYIIRSAPHPVNRKSFAFLLHFVYNKERRRGY